MISLQEAKELKYGQILHSVLNVNADNSPQRWKVSGKVKTWKTQPNRVKVPIKFGLYTHGYITEHDLHKYYIPRPRTE
jgi:hypothetical protein